MNREQQALASFDHISRTGGDWGRLLARIMTARLLANPPGGPHDSQTPRERSWIRDHRR